MQAAIYTRVSTADQNSELQLRELQEYAKRQGWEIVQTYEGVISGAKASRPGLNRLMEDARARTFDCLMVWKLDRFGRSLVDCLNNIQELERWRIRFIATTQNLGTDETNPASRFLLHVLGAAAEFERSLTRERTLAGQIRYRLIMQPERWARASPAVPGRTSHLTGPSGSLTVLRCVRGRCDGGSKILVSIRSANDGRTRGGVVRAGRACF
jgi:putative DNA-invertase from lambdoid prophage Rac